jgi:hypothetical protein
MNPGGQEGKRRELGEIVNEPLSAVTFVQDYVQLHFGGSMVTAITLPAVIVGDVIYEGGAPGYRDRLCEQINKIVTRAFVEPNDRVQIDFSDHSSIMIPLRPENYRAAEAVIFQDEKTKRYAVW